MRRAFTLAETVLCLSLLAIVFLVVTNLIPVAIYGQVEVRHRLEAGSLAGEVLNTCAAQGIERFPLGHADSTSGGVASAYLQDRTGYDGIVYRSTLDVERVTYGSGSVFPDNKLKLFKVKVQWHERNRTLDVTRIRQLARVIR